MPAPAALVDELSTRIRPLEIEAGVAWWEDNTHSSPDSERRHVDAELARSELFADADAFADVRAARDEARAATTVDPLVNRHLDLLYNAFVPNQIDSDLRREIVELETSVGSRFNNFRATIDGRRLDDNAVREILRTSDDVAARQAAWEASKQIGAEVAGDLRELARLRNRAARGLGFRDHFALALATQELDEDRLFATLADVDRVTAAQFTTWKRGFEESLATRFGCDPAELRPWHLDDPFFQELPAGEHLPLDELFTDADVEALTIRTYDGLGLDVRRVLGHSDLYPRDGKNQHAFCIDIDREGDVRVLANVEPSERWMDTMLHEFGHAMYDQESDPSLPWLLRGASHALTTEGVAMLMGRLPRDPEWLNAVAGVARDTVDALGPRLADARRSGLLVFARWVLVMTLFERALYADPEADLDRHWWDLVEHHQRVHRPDGSSAPDWAAKIHLAAAPVYYQNYLYGELFASQLYDTLVARAGGVVNRLEAGALLVRDVFAPGSSSRWDDLVRHATGEPLSATHLAGQLA